MVNASSKFLAFTLVAFIFSTTNTCDALRILGLFPFPGKSHYAMCEQLMISLAAKGHQVDVYSHFPLEKLMPNFKHFNLHGTMSVVYNNLSFDVASLPSATDMIAYWWGTFSEPTCDLMSLPIFQKLLNDPPKDPPYDLVINELCIASCYIPFGRYLNVPIIAVVTPPLIDWMYEYFGNPLNPATDLSIFSTYDLPMTFFERLNNFITFHTVVWTYYQYAKVQEKHVEKFFGPGYPNILDLQKDISLVFVNHESTIAGVKTFAPLIVPVGGLHVVDNNETLTEVVQKWLDESKDGCIYFSFGSMARIETFPIHILDTFYKTIENIKPVRVLLKIAYPEELPPNLPSNVLTQPWLQQIQIFKHKNLKAFVTHGGLMGTQEAVYFGVPMVGVPLFGDQHLNVMGCVRRNISIKVDLDSLTEKTFTNALKEILYNPLYRRSMQKVSKKFKDRPMSPADTAIYWVEYISKYGKDALKSPTTDMPWWQKCLLDVYCFIAAIVILVLYISFKLLKVVLKLIRECQSYSTKLKKN